MLMLIAQTAAETDGVNLFPLIVVVIVLAAAAAVVYARRNRSPK